MDVYDFIDVHDGNVIRSWVRGLCPRDRAKFKVKVRALADMEYDRAIGSKLLQGPISKHIFKLKIHGQIMMRPLLCRGPIANEAEYTLLAGAREENFVLIPDVPLLRVEIRRQEVIDNPASRRQTRVRS